MTIPAGFALLFLGLFAMLLSAHFKGLRYFDRPTAARTPHFDSILDALKWGLVATGLLLLWRGSRPIFLTSGALLVVLWSLRRFLRSRFLRGRLLRRDFTALRRQRPDLSDGEILFDLAYRRHARWGPELIEQMVKDYPTLEEFSRMMVLMERGFRGFRGRRPAVPRGGGGATTRGEG